MPKGRIALGPRPSRFARAAVEAAGGRVVDPGDAPDGLVWLDPADVAGLRGALASGSPEWVQLPWAGIEPVVEAGLLDGRVWTCAKGAYAEPVAEHALMLALAGLRRMPARARATSWGPPAGLSLFDERVVILGGGGIATALVSLLRPLRAEITVLRRTPRPMEGVARCDDLGGLDGALGGALVVVLALALTPETVGVIGAPQLAAMREEAWLVNVARGRHVDTGALVDALAAERIGGAALDVTDPEPLPDGHPLWTSERAIVTPHTADTPEMVRAMLGSRIEANVRHWIAGEPLVGLVDVAAGY